MEFGKNLRLVRKKMKLSQIEFAIFLDLPQPTLSAYETGRNTPNMDALVRIARKCGISLDWLCGISQKANVNPLEVQNILEVLLEASKNNRKIELHVHLSPEQSKSYNSKRIKGTTGEKIKYYRRLSKMTQKELGIKIGVTEVAIRKYENDERTPKFAKIAKIAEVLGVSSNDLVEEHREETQA